MNEEEKNIDLKDLGEFGLIERLTKKIKLFNDNTLLGPGDDAAIINSAKEILVSSDMLVEGIHFDMAFTPLKHLGYKSVIINISDIYAMNGNPKQITVSLAISSKYTLEAIEEFYDGIVIQAAGATMAVTAVMLGMYLTGIIRVTDRFRKIVISATLGLMLFYLVTWVVSLFGGNVSFLSSPSLMSIGFSVLVVGLAAMNLALDFDFIERGAQSGLPKHFEWFAAFGLLVTLVWLYLEILRLLAKMRDR